MCFTVAMPWTELVTHTNNGNEAPWPGDASLEQHRII